MRNEGFWEATEPGFVLYVRQTPAAHARERRQLGDEGPRDSDDVLTWLSDFGIEDEDALGETMNYWKQLPHVLKYWRVEEDKNAKLPPNFMTGFLEGHN
ncbi:NADh-ubiquinone oxidoreductase kda subunit protein [Rutstroemia sp. NJR-2017a BBW]|nr:NADh-ubiquinone oxidoreductase kda subunit protein [Rutstroemia sp. NJR-2017a BBW]